MCCTIKMLSPEVRDVITQIPYFDTIGERCGWVRLRQTAYPFGDQKSVILHSVAAVFRAVARRGKGRRGAGVLRDRRSRIHSGYWLTIFIMDEYLNERHFGMSSGPIRSSQKNKGKGAVGTLMWTKVSGEQWKSLSSILLGLKKNKNKNKNKKTRTEGWASILPAYQKNQLRQAC